jgi:hypothetical protein
MKGVQKATPTPSRRAVAATDDVVRTRPGNSFAGCGALFGRKRDFTMAAIAERPLLCLATPAEGDFGLAITALKPVSCGIENGNVSLDHQRSMIAYTNMI